MFCSREWIKRLFRKNGGDDKLPCPPSSPSGIDNHNYFVLEKHVNKTDDDTQLQVNNVQDHYALAQDQTYYETTTADLDDDYDTTEQSQAGRGKSRQPVNVYNTFNDFKHQEDYDHIGDHKKHGHVTENEYSTTEVAMTQPNDDDTYNHLNQGQQMDTRTDNVYGMPHASNKNF